MKQSHSVLPKTNRSATISIFKVFRVFSHVVLRYRNAHQAILVLIIDNANRLPQLLLAQLQDFAKETSDSGIATVIFVSSEGHIQRLMRDTSTLSRGSICHIISNHC